MLYSLPVWLQAKARKADQPGFSYCLCTRKLCAMEKFHVFSSLICLIHKMGVMHRSGGGCEKQVKFCI